MGKVIRNFFCAIWNGIMKVLDFFATLFGLYDESKYVHVLRCINATVFSLLFIWVMFLLVLLSLDIDVEDVFERRPDPVVYRGELSPNLKYYQDYRWYGNDGYLTDANGKKLIQDIAWVANPMNGDSLVCYSNGQGRGYFHISDGRVVVKPIYRHAWVFSEGLAAVDDKGMVKFIDNKGNVVINRNFAYKWDVDGYVFHNGHCAVNEEGSRRMGLIDHNGDWVLPPIYNKITPIDTFWILSLEDQQSIISFGLHTIIPMTNAVLEVDDTTIRATLSDHSLSLYSLQGRLLVASQVNDVMRLEYETHEIVYPVCGNGGDEESDDNFHYYKNAVATCLCYEAEKGWYGLMSTNGQQLTPPLYISIKAVEKDLYLCKASNGRGILLNSKGQYVK